MGLKKHKLAHEVVGLSRNRDNLNIAIRNGSIDHGYDDVKKAVHNTDLVILATPVNTIIQFLTTLGPHIRRNCMVTDVGSSKASIISTAQKHLPNFPFFVGSHPLAGSEKKGAEFASADLFQGSLCIMTPTEKTHRVVQDRVRILWTKLGATVKTMSPDEHDRVLAYISHLPHAVAYALMASVPDECLPYAAQGLKDTTRIAASSPQMWADICLANGKNLIKSLDEGTKNLSLIRKAIVSRDDHALVELFTKSKAKRDGIDQR